MSDSNVHQHAASMHYSAMPLAHLPLATTRHTSHRPTLRYFGISTNKRDVVSSFLQIGLSDAGLPGWSTSLAMFLDFDKRRSTGSPSILIPGIHGNPPSIRHSECQAKLWQVTCLSNIGRPVPYVPYVPYIPHGHWHRGPLVSIREVVYTGHTHLLLSIHLSF